jgi:hypothetical protein
MSRQSVASDWSAQAGGFDWSWYMAGSDHGRGHDLVRKSARPRFSSDLDQATALAVAPLPALSRVFPKFAAIAHLTVYA